VIRIKITPIRIKATSKNVIPAKAGIQNPLISLDSGLRGSDKLIIIRGSHNIKGLKIELTRIGKSPLAPLCPPGQRPYGPAAKEG